MTCTIYVLENFPEGQGRGSIPQAKLQNNTEDLPPWWGTILDVSEVMERSSFREFLSEAARTLDTDYILFASTGQCTDAEGILAAIGWAAESKADALAISTELGPGASLSSEEAALIYGCQSLKVSCPAYPGSIVPFHGLVMSSGMLRDFAEFLHLHSGSIEAAPAWVNTSRGLAQVLANFCALTGREIWLSGKPHFELRRSLNPHDNPTVRELRAATLVSLEKATRNPTLIKKIMRKAPKRIMDLALAALYSGSQALLHPLRSVRRFRHWLASRPQGCSPISVRFAHQQAVSLNPLAAGKILRDSIDRSFQRIKAFKASIRCPQGRTAAL